MPTFTTIKVTTESRTELEKFKLQIAGLLQRPINQGQALEIMAILARNHMNEALRIAKEILP